MNNVFLEQQFARTYKPQDSLVNNSGSIMYGDWKKRIDVAYNVSIKNSDTNILSRFFYLGSNADGAQGSVTYTKEAEKLLHADFKKISFRMITGNNGQSWPGYCCFSLFGTPSSLPYLTQNPTYPSGIALADSLNFIHHGNCPSVNYSHSEVYFTGGGQEQFIVHPNAPTGSGGQEHGGIGTVTIDYEITRETITAYDNSTDKKYTIPYDITKVNLYPVFRISQTRYKPNTTYFGMELLIQVTNFLVKV